MPSSRRSPKFERIVRAIREDIVSGRYAPGAQFPFRTELSEVFGVTPVTLQRAFDHLRDEGFIYARGRGGTFVAETPPCTSHFALVSPRQAARYENGSLQLRAIEDAVHVLEGEQSIRLVPYRDVYDSQEGEARGETHDRLMDDIHNHRLAGLIFTNNPWPISESSLVNDGDLPRVAWMSDRSKSFPQVGAVWTDNYAFMRMGLEVLAERGCKRVGLLTLPACRESWTDYFREEAEARGLDCRGRWIQGVDFGHARWAANCVELLMQGGAEDRPDGLVIGDDHLVSHAAAGILSAGVRVPDDLQVICYANFPVREAPVLPFVRIGFDAEETLGLCLDWLRDRREGNAAEGVIRVPPRFEDEKIAAGREAV